MHTKTLKNGSDSFDVSLREAQAPSSAVLFSLRVLGATPNATLRFWTHWLNPVARSLRHIFNAWLLRVPTDAELTFRARRLCHALDAFLHPGTTVVGVGHSIGAATLIALAGGHMWLGPGRRANIATDERLTRLGLLAPATGFPGAGCT